MLNLTQARRTALGICHVHMLDGGTVLRTFRALTPRAATRKATRYITHLKIEDRRSQHAEEVTTKKGMHWGLPIVTVIPVGKRIPRFHVHNEHFPGVFSSLRTRFIHAEP